MIPDTLTDFVNFGLIVKLINSSSWCREGLGTGGEGDDRGWDGWMASPTQWAWVRVNSRSWWWTGRPGVLRFMGSQSHTWLSDWTLTEWKFSLLDSSQCDRNKWQQFSSGHGANVAQTGVNTTHVRSRRWGNSRDWGDALRQASVLHLFWDTWSPWESKVNPGARGSKWDGCKREILAMVSGAWEVVFWAPSHLLSSAHPYL